MTRTVITQQSVLSQRKTELPCKTNDSLDNLRIDKTNMDGAPKTTFNKFRASGTLSPSQKNPCQLRK